MEKEIADGKIVAQERDKFRGLLHTVGLVVFGPNWLSRHSISEIPDEVLRRILEIPKLDAVINEVRGQNDRMFTLIATALKVEEKKP